MARYKEYSYSQGKFIPIHFSKQILPGTFEYTLNYLIDNELDLSVFDSKYKNDDTGAPAYDPAILLKIVLYGYSKGIVSSRKIAQCCCENIIFMALSADTRPHFTTIAEFISSMDKEIIHLFRDILLICDDQGLIGKEMFAIDGCKLPSNASKEWSGTKSDFEKKAVKMETAISRILKRHRENDLAGTDKEIIAKEERYIKTLRNRVKKIQEWLSDNDDKIGKSGKPIKSNITDNDSAKMKTSKGVIQGYDGVTAVDGKHQVIVHAEAFGQAQEHDLLKPMVDGVCDNFESIRNKEDVFKDARLLADSGFHTEQNMKMLFSEEIDAYVADNLFRKRDPRFADAERHKKRHRRNLFAPRDFTFTEDLSHCICPAGKRLYRSGGNAVSRGGFRSVRFKGPKSACVHCKLRSQCLRHPERTQIRQVAYFIGRTEKGKNTFTERMKRKIDSVVGRALYAIRLAIGEPPFANIRSALRLDRFTLRGKRKVNIQWNLFCMIHNMKKIQRYGPGFA
ncbi:MAG: transposase [Thermotogota bacterium]|nr:transposase [Thermotogota bacterium]